MSDTRDPDRTREAANVYEAWQKLMPDSRPTRYKRTVQGPLGAMQQTYCVNCSRAGGFVTEQFIEHILYLCDDCVAKHGHLPLPQLPEGD